MFQGEKTSSISRLVTLKPRQVLLAEQKQKQLGKLGPGSTMAKKQHQQPINQKTDTLEAEFKLALLHSVIKYVSDKGFAKTFKRFLKEARVEDDAWKADSFDLEEMYCKYLKVCRNADPNFESQKEQEQRAFGTVEKDASGDKDAAVETISKKKKKKKNEENDNSEKQKVEIVSPFEDGKGAEAADMPFDNSKAKLKEKKKKKKDSLSEKLFDNGLENEGKLEETPENLADKESKKRKRSDSDEIKDKFIEEVEIEESKRQKTEGVKETRVAVQQRKVKKVLEGDGRVGGETNEENGTENSSIKQFDESTKGLKSNRLERSSAKKQRNGSIEPKTVNAFQRVKVDAVEYADNRLQDNSYWAKDGAEIGYGAKAQEVLGQVKGRDFRHEKTKKKRGSYRGGLIDLQSHSVKFNYADED